ncbi:MAG: hypothetical protein QM790_16995 [Nibricoccus sp.]
MKTMLIAGGVLLALFATACTDREAEARRVKEEAEAKARAEAARKEMDALPKTFQTPDYFKRNKPAQKPAASTEPNKSNNQSSP